MKKYPWYLLLVIILFIGVGCTTTSEDEEDPADGSSAEAYYAGGSGSTFAYEGTRTDSNGTAPYTRDANFGSQQTENNTTYIQQNNVITVGLATTSGDFLFRRTTTGLFIYIDATIFTELLDSSGIDPSLVTINADPEIRMISYPFADTPEWDAFVVRASALAGLVNLDIIKVTGNYRGQEQLTIMQQNQTAEKVEYIGTIKIPDSIENIANPTVINVSATAWFVKDVGLVKLQGSGFLISILGGGELEFSEDTSTASETLVNYSLK